MTTFAAPPTPEAGPEAAAAWVNEAGADTLAGRMGM
ncbi:thioesterase, partial [Streptomyces sp. SID8455]|nr:thioesterase [Streptomyces sp. SID8455]